MSFLTLIAMTKENFDRLDYGLAIPLANQLLPVQQTETLSDGTDNIMIIIGAVVGVISLLALLSMIGVVSFVLCRQFK